MRPSTERLRRAISDLGAALYRARAPLAGLRMLPLGRGVAPAEQPIPPADDPRWLPVTVGTRWGGRDENAWFAATAHLPDEWRGQLAADYDITLRLSVGRGSEHAFGWPEGLLYVNGRLQQGINRYHPDTLVRDEDVRGSGQVAIAARVWSGLSESDHRIQSAEIALLHRPSERLYHLLAQGERLVHALPEADPLTHALFGALETALDTLDLHDPDGASAALDRSSETALAELEARLEEMRARYNPAERPLVTAVGHGHLDVAWLWQTRHTREKAARTFSVTDALMDRYPEYVFLHTTPQVFAWLERDYPELFKRVRERVAAGRFEAAGAMWLESDCNLVAGESLVRQIVHGQRYLRERFGAEYAALWLPDAFGYNAQLPQIMLRAGLTTFMTTKMSWSETNRIPFDTFRWRGLDGSEVLAHFITTPAMHAEPPLKVIDTYNGGLDVRAVRGVWERYRQKAINSEVLLAFGYGDGGAGPSRQMIEQARAMRLLPGLPQIRLGRADAFFERLRERVWDSPELPVWDGELYLEYHRGTYTTQAWLKRAHRQNEARLLLAESLDAWQHALDGEQAPDRRAALDDAWRTLLLHEFHDILPGSSIGPVYADAREAMSALAATLEELACETLAAIGAHVGAPGERDRHGLLVYNPSPWPRDLLPELPNNGQGYTDGGGEPLVAQRIASDVADPADATALVLVPRVPGRGLVQIASAKTAMRVVAFHGEPAGGSATTLENAFFHITFAPGGEITSLVDKRVPAGRELVAPSAALNQLEAYDDRPPHFDAWDIDASFERKPYPVTGRSVELVESGPLRATMRVTHSVLESSIEQDVSVYATIPRIDFATRIVWRDHQVLLKAAFPLDLRTTRFTSETAYGAVERPTHRNTSWDQARFETPAHRWVDLSEAGYGVSLLNDGRYGHDVHDNTLRLTLLRSPVAPDPDADQGAHEVTYSLYPHLEDWRAGGTVAEAYALNRPPIVTEVVGDASRGSVGRSGEHEVAAALAQGAPNGVVVEAIKRAADGDGLIVRVYEAHGARVRATVTLGVPFTGVDESDLLERPLREGESPAYAEWHASRNASHDAPAVADRGFTFELRPHEVRTFRVT